MEPYIVEKTKKTPYISFDQSIGKLEIIGYSLPSDSYEFYKQLFQLVDDYIAHPQEITEIIFRIEYFNTSSSKVILHLISKFEVLISMEKQVSVTWYVEEEDVDMNEAGKTYQASTNLSITIVPIDEE